MDGFFEVAGCDWGGVGDCLGEVEGGGFEVFGRGYGVEEADFEGFVGGEGTACQQKVEGAGASDDSGKSLGAAVPGDDAIGEG